MDIAVVVLSLAVALLRGGRPVEEHGLRYIWVPVAAVAIQIAVGLWMQNAFGTVLIMVSYIALLLMLAANWNHQSCRILLLGTFLNFVVMILNGGRMPVDMVAAAQLGLPLEGLAEGQIFKHIGITEATRMPFLADVIPINFGIRRLISIGDVFVAIGLFSLVQHLMGKGFTLKPLPIDNPKQSEVS